MYRHGDVLIIPTTKQAVDQMDRVSKPGEDIVLAEGETTGHAHRIAARYIAALYLLRETQQRILKVQQESRLTHEEHNTIILPPGDYLVVQQQEYTPERIRPVAD
jgi:hypothetical protein